MFIDLDGFKQMNDNHGHAVGDKVLQITADRLNGQIGPDNVACRLGGDEFLVVVGRSLIAQPSRSWVLGSSTS